MDGYDSIFDGPTIEAKAPKKEKPSKDPNRKTVGGKFVKFIQPWDWEVKPKGPPKDVKWWSIWRWKFWNAGPTNLKRFPIPSLAGLMTVDPRSWDIMERWANRLAVGAVFANLVICAMYAFIVATQSELPITRGWDARIPLPNEWFIPIGAVARYTVVCILAAMALISAVVMQLGSDFSIPFGSGLAGERYRLIPTLSVVAFVVCILLTASIKIDVFTGWGRERIAAAAEKTTVSNSDQRVLDKYVVAIPPPVAESEGVITAANSQIKTLEGERAIKDAARTEEDKQLGGRGPKWNKLNDEVGVLDTKLAAERQRLALATGAKANRLEYEGADTRNKTTVRTVTEAERQLLYDSSFVVWIRGVGMSLISPFFVLASFMIRAAKAQAAKRASAKEKEIATKQQNKNTFEGEFTEGAPINAPPIEHDPNAAPGTITGWDPVKTTPDTKKHPDPAGDNFVPPRGKADGEEGDDGAEVSS